MVTMKDFSNFSSLTRRLVSLVTIKILTGDEVYLERITLFFHKSEAF